VKLLRDTPGYYDFRNQEELLPGDNQEMSPTKKNLEINSLTSIIEKNRNTRARNKPGKQEVLPTPAGCHLFSLFYAKLPVSYRHQTGKKHLLPA